MAIRFKDTISINEEYTFPLQDGTIDQVLSTDGAGVISFVDLPDGEAVKIACKNTTASTITKGTPVYITGTVGSSFIVEIAPADSANSAKMPASGLLETDLAPNGEGFVVTGGLLKNLITDPIDGSTPSTNQTIYVKPGGGLTLTKPTGSNLIQNIGKVGRVNSSNAGSIIVSSILRTNDVPNLTEGKIWVGSANNTIESTVVHIDETNERVGINKTSPAVDLDILNSTSSGIVRIVDTNSADVRLSASGNASSVGTNSTHDFNIKTNNAARMTIDSTGNVGIGYNSPSNTLHIYKNATIGAITSTTTANAGLRIQDSNTSMYFDGNSIVLDNNGFLTTNGAYDFVLGTNNTARIHIDSGGNIGIGTTSPSTKLYVNKTTVATKYIDSYSTAVIEDTEARLQLVASNGGSNAAAITLSNEANHWSIHHRATNVGNYLAIGYVNTTSTTDIVNSAMANIIPLAIKTNGNVGIGTTSPSSTLTVRKDGSSTINEVIRLENLGAGNNEGSEISWYSNDGKTANIRSQNSTNSYGNLILDTFDNDHLTVAARIVLGGTFDGVSDTPFIALSTSNTERMRIDSSGNVGIGAAPYASTLGTFQSIDLGQSASMWGYLNSVYLNSNAYYNGGWLYKNADDAGVFQIDGNTLTFRQAASGAAGTGISLTEAFRINGSGAVSATVDMRAPIFYDSDDTAWYVDPASTTHINNVVISSTAPSTSGYSVDIYDNVHMHNFEINYVSQLHFNDNVRFYDDGNDNYLNFKYGDAAGGGIRVLDGNTTTQGYLYGDGSGGFGLLDKDGHWALYTNGASQLQLRSNNNVEFYVYNSYTYSPGSSRAPIFYDSNDTSYYLNPNDGSTNPVLRFYGSRVLSRYVSSWTGNEDHDILYSGYASTLGDYVYLKAAGNSSSSLGSIVITDGAGFYFGRSSSRTGGVDNSASNPISTVLFRVDNSGNTYAQSLYDSGDTSYYLNPAGVSNIHSYNRGLAEVAGWVPAYSNSNPDTVRWNTTEDATELQSSSDTSTGAAFRAIRVKSGQTIRITLTVRASAASSSGFYIRSYQYNGNMPDGKTHVSNSASYSFVQEDSSGTMSWGVENSSIGTAWTTYEKEFLITADGYFSVVVLNWTGMGSNSLYLKTPTYDVVQIQQNIYYDDNNSSYYVDPASGSNLNTVTAVSLTETSALRFKNNIEENIDASIIDKLRPVSYNWKENNDKDYGFIAEEVNELDATLTTKQSGGELIGIKYTRLIPFLVKKIQEQEERIKQLENGNS